MIDGQRTTDADVTELYGWLLNTLIAARDEGKDLDEVIDAVAKMVRRRLRRERRESAA